MIRRYCDSCGVDTTGEDRGVTALIVTLHMEERIDAEMSVQIKQRDSTHAADLCNACSERIRDGAICRWANEQIDKKSEATK